MRKLKFVVLLAALISGGGKSYAHDIEVANADGVTIYYNYTNDQTELAVTYQGSEYWNDDYAGNVVIPESVTYEGNTYAVTSIGDYAFFRCDALTEVTIPGSVTSIGDSAFESCSSLTEVTIPGSVTSIGNYAFTRCNGLTEVTIPGSVTTIGGAAFGGCNSLTEVTISDGEDILVFPTSASSPIFSGSPVETLYLGRTVSGRMSFLSIKSLKTLTIGNSVTSIGEGAFMDCSGLTEVTIPSSVTSIGALAFDRCSGLTEVTIPNSVTTIGEGAFWDCSSLTEVTISDGEDILAFPTSALSPIFNGSPVETLYLGRTISGSMSFIGIRSLKTLTIGNSVTSIDDFAFAQCSGLTEVTIGNSVTSIGILVFGACSALTTLYSLSTTPPSVESISFDDNHYATVDLFVPAEALEAYQTANVWKEFQKLQAIGGTATAIEKVSANGEQIQTANGQVTVTGLTDGTTVAVYDLSGRQVGTATSKGGQVSISTGMTAGAAAIVKVGERSVKTVMK